MIIHDNPRDQYLDYLVEYSCIVQTNWRLAFFMTFLSLQIFLMLSYHPSCAVVVIASIS